MRRKTAAHAASQPRPGHPRGQRAEPYTRGRRAWRRAPPAPARVRGPTQGQPTDRPPFQRRRRAVIPKPQGPRARPVPPSPVDEREWRAPSHRARETQSAENRAEASLGHASGNDHTARVPHGRRAPVGRARRPACLCLALPRGSGRTAAKGQFTGTAAFHVPGRRSQKPRSAKHASSSSTQRSQKRLHWPVAGHASRSLNDGNSRRPSSSSSSPSPSPRTTSSSRASTPTSARRASP